MKLQEEIEKLRILRASVKLEYQRTATSIIYAVSNLVSVNPTIYTDIPPQEPGHYHVVVSFSEFNHRELDHCDFNWIFVKTGQRLAGIATGKERELIPYDHYLRIGNFREKDGQLVVRASDGYVYGLPLNTFLYIAHRKVYKKLDECIALLIAQQIT